MLLDIQSTIDSARISTGSPLESRMKEAAERKGPSFENTLNAEINSSTGRASRPVDKRLKETCVEYESIFVARMLKSMRENVQKNEWLHGGHAEEIFEDMLYDEYAHSISKNSNLGIADMLYKELSGQRGVGPSTGF